MPLPPIELPMNELFVPALVARPIPGPRLLAITFPSAGSVVPIDVPAVPAVNSTPLAPLASGSPVGRTPMWFPMSRLFSAPASSTPWLAFLPMMLPPPGRPMVLLFEVMMTPVVFPNTGPVGDPGLTPIQLPKSSLPSPPEIAIPNSNRPTASPLMRESPPATTRPGTPRPSRSPLRTMAGWSADWLDSGWLYPLMRTGAMSLGSSDSGRIVNDPSAGSN